MASVDLHEKPFDDTTIAKLEIFEDYAQEWLPTFIMQGVSPLCIFDFFAGTGYDKKGIPGSSIRILNKIKEQIVHIVQKKVTIQLYLNEYDSDKFALLKESCENYLNANLDVKGVTKINYYKEDFDVCFNKLLPIIDKYVSLVYLDQNGIKFLSEKYFLALEKTTRTDFLYFVSASYFWRFGHKQEFKMHLDIDMEKAKKDPYQFIHRNLLSQLRQKLPADTNLKLYPYSLKKGTNIHGIIFGASHIRAVDKFLSLTWKKNTTNGEANFDIDDDSGKVQVDLFVGKRLTKIESFYAALRQNILSGAIGNNIEAYNFTLNNGHIAEHARHEVKNMKDQGLIQFKGHSKISYDAFSSNEVVEFERTKK